MAISDWAHIFTVPDESLLTDSSVDPMGMQMIWTDFGQKIFNYKLTTVATDIRNFTINLFHHYLLYRLEHGEPQVFAKAIAHFPDYRNAYDVKAGLLMFLEDLLIYALMEQGDSVETRGLLGSYKAQQMLKQDPETIWIEAEKTKGVLVRQIQLGINGRYKGPFINMKLLTTHFKYEPEWERIGLLMSGGRWPAGKRLAEELLEKLRDLLEHSAGKYPRRTLAELKDPGLWKLYRDCFGERKGNPVFSDFWVEQLGLMEGAAKAVYCHVPGLEKDNLPLWEVIERASREDLPDEERRKLEHILDLEPFLSICSQIFYRLCNPATKHVHEIQEEVDLLVQRMEPDKISSLLAGKGNPRLALLWAFVSKGIGNPEEVIRQIVGYHEQVMKERGSFPWVELKDGAVKQYYHQSERFSTEELLSENRWYHDYYLNSLASIYRGLNPENA